MMRGQRGWRELAVLGDKIDKVSGLIEGFIFSPKSVEVKSGAFNDHTDQWSSEEVLVTPSLLQLHLTMTLCFPFALLSISPDASHKKKSRKTVKIFSACFVCIPCDVILTYLTHRNEFVFTSYTDSTPPQPPYTNKITDFPCLP